MKSMHKLANHKNHIKQLRENKLKNTRKKESCLKK